MTDDNELLDISEAAQFLNVSETSLRRWTNAGVLPCLRIGRRRERRFRRGDLLAFMEQPTPQQPSPIRKTADSAEFVPRDEPVTVAHGNHLCGIYGTDTGLLSLCVPFLLEGLRGRSVCLFAGPRALQKRVLKSLQGLHPTLPTDIKEGRVVLSEYQKSAKAQWKYWVTQLEKTQKHRTSSFRILGDTLGIRGHVSAEELIEYEAGIDDRITRKFPVEILCTYDARRFSGVELLNALKTHRDTFRYPLGRALA
jgi:excisionase family DNA binding protein